MSPGASPTARALRALEILQSHPGVTAGVLGERLGVTERAARRYVGVLREAGIPVLSTRGPAGGYQLGRGVHLPPVVFTEPEALTLVMAVLDGRPTATDVDDPVGAALNKVISVLPPSARGPAAALREHAAATPEPNPAAPDPLTTSALVAAAAARRVVRISYQSEAGTTWEGVVDPWAVVSRFGRWYLLCHSHHADAVRTYRVDRVSAVSPTGASFTPPADLDPVAALAEHLGAGWAFSTRVEFDAPLGSVAPWIRPVMGRLEPQGDGCVLVGTTGNPAMYAQEWLACVPFPYRVIEGPELHAAVAALAARCAAAVGVALAPTGAARRRRTPARRRSTSPVGGDR